MFWYLQDVELLDITDELQLLVLRLVFTLNSWDNHPLRTIQNWAPNLLWVIDQIQYNPSDNVTNVDDSYGVNCEGPESPESRAKLEKSSDSWISILILMLGNLTNFIYEIKEILYTDESFTVKFTIRFIFITDCHGS